MYKFLFLLFVLIVFSCFYLNMFFLFILVYLVHSSFSFYLHLFSEIVRFLLILNTLLKLNYFKIKLSLNLNSTLVSEQFHEQFFCYF